MVLLAPSLLAADFRCLQQQVQMVENAGADWLHLDVMDGHFVPNLSFGADIIHQLRSISKLFFDAHLMVEEPYDFLPMFVDCGADQITVHYEACADMNKVIDYLKQHHIRCGISLKPSTPAEVLQPYLDQINNILVMTVEPGFGGQKFMSEQLQKIAQLRTLIAQRKITLEVDGGINLQTAQDCIRSGVDVLVAGNAVFKATDPVSVIQQMKNLGETR